MCYRPLARFFCKVFYLAREDRELALMASFGDLPTEIAQNCVEFLAFDEAIEVKSVWTNSGASLRYKRRTLGDAFSLALRECGR